MALENLVFILIFILSISFFAKNIRRIIGLLKLGKSDVKFDKVSERLKSVLVYVLFQKKLFREKSAGLIHSLIFWGFILFSFSVAEAIIQGFYSNFSFESTFVFYSLITLTQDLFGFLVIASVLWALVRRHILTIKRLQVDKEANKDATLILVMILLVVLSMFGQNIFHLLKNNSVLSLYELRPVTKHLTRYFSFISVESSAVLFKVFWWFHILLVLAFLNYLPYSKHFHIISSIPNVYFGKISGQKNIINKLNLEDESIEIYGAKDITELKWKDLLDGFACTQCGRCTDACPAAAAGKILSPKKIIVDIRKRAQEYSLGDNKSLIHNFISDEELWQCTTCMACVEECPVLIEHLEKIVDLRRYLVLNETKYPSSLNSVFTNLETNGNLWAFNNNDRGKWADGLSIKTMAEDSNCDLLFWVGCAGSFDARNIKVSVSFAKIMQKAGIEFRILGSEEKCNGDTARRLGNEYLAQLLMSENSEILKKYGIKKIVTACPHCYNSLKNEYKQFGGNFEVIHHSELIAQLIKEKRIELKNNESEKFTTYHDSCYLGRYNGIYEEPREIINSIPNMRFLELDRIESKGFCCGAGGGQMFIDDNNEERINLNRTKEIIEKKVDQVCTACPFCMTMLSDGLKHYQANEKIQVLDISEIVLNNLK